MVSNIILPWSIIILAIVSLIVLIKRRNRIRKKNLFSVLQSFAKENNSEISSCDQWDKTLIGIDTSEINSLFFIRTISDTEFREVINLSEVKKCRLIKTERTEFYHKENVNVIDKIELVFSFFDTPKPDIRLEFYNTDYDKLTLSGELQLAQKWSETVASILVSIQNLEKGAIKEKIQATPVLNEPVSLSRLSAFASKRNTKHAIQTI